MSIHVTGLSWLGVRTVEQQRLVEFVRDVLGVPIGYEEPGMTAFSLPSGDHLEVFAPAYPGKDHFVTGPVVGFGVTDPQSSVEHLRQCGVELLGAPGPTWQHFRGPDGNVYELKGRG